ncbi:DUF2703 domain-containing protein [Patescibacteria group bacterium]|nr:DUF2703 domain-containing protein [Patescibacteria group bacterium]
MKNQPTNQSNEGIELLYTKDCQAWPTTLVNLKKALAELKVTDKPKIIKINTIIEAQLYNFFASPAIHINGQDIDPTARRSHKRGLGYGRPYFYNKSSHPYPSVEQIKSALQKLYFDKV